MVGCTKSTKNINKYAKCYGSSFCSSQTHDWYYSCSCSLNESPWLSFHTVPRQLASLRPRRRRRGRRRQRRRERGRLQRRGRRGGQLRRRLRQRGGVDDVVGGVGGGLGLSVDTGHVVDGVADLVADKTGLGDQVGLDGLVDGGGGDSDGDGGVDGL